jgi:hypothetical protein
VPVKVRAFSTYALDLTILMCASKKPGPSRTGTPPSRPPKVPAAALAPPALAPPRGCINPIEEKGLKKGLGR